MRTTIISVSLESSPHAQQETISQTIPSYSSNIHGCMHLRHPFAQWQYSWRAWVQSYWFPCAEWKRGRAAASRSLKYFEFDSHSEVVVKITFRGLIWLICDCCDAGMPRSRVSRLYVCHVCHCFELRPRRNWAGCHTRGDDHVLKVGACTQRTAFIQCTN